MQLRFMLTLLAVLVPFVTCTVVASNACNTNEFWWPDKECCLPNGGPPKPPSPPKGTTCPPSGYYWDQKHGCCVPRNPPNHPPQCPMGWTWYSALWRCHPTPTPPKYPPTFPSAKPGEGMFERVGKDDNYGNLKRKRSNSRKDQLQASLCPSGLDACPVMGLLGDYECIDIDAELESCGGCTTLGNGQDCTAISNAWNVGCENGSCIVYSCEKNLRISPDGKTCIL